MEVTLHWKDGLTFAGFGAQKKEIAIDVIEEQGGHGSGASPMELTLMAVCGCSGMDIISIMQKKQQKVTAFEIKASGERSADYPKVFTKVHIEYIFTGASLDPAAANRSVELSLTKYCSVYPMLAKAIDFDTKVTIREG
ncbi:MAG TPA: OsmC family protein [Bellilinea sp.]|nr:OsmC family protein [Bellilinea sp.]